MCRSLLLISFVALSLRPAAAQDKLTTILNFETQHPGGTPAGWGGGPAGTIFADNQVVHGGKWSARIERGSTSAEAFSSMTHSIPMDVTGTKIVLRGFLRLENVSDYAGFWMREDGESGAVAFQSMEDRHVTGTRDWEEYSIELPVREEARRLFIGVILTGTGKLWADDLQLLVDGKPLSEAPRVERPKTPMDTDQEFDHGSGIEIKALTPAQIGNLAALGRVWGFVKYHHPRVVSGHRHFDYDLFRVLPAILAAEDRAAANRGMVRWIASLGTVDPCKTCASLNEKNLHLRPDLDWIGDEKLLGADLSRLLRSIYANRPADGKQFYLSMVPGVGNPEFRHELAYRSVKLPDAGFEILALYRFWNIIEYWSPYRDAMGEDWPGVLAEFVPRIAMATSSEPYQRELMALIARAHDTHANLWSSLHFRPPTGDCQLPVLLRFIENRFVVTGFAGGEKTTPFQVGDVLSELDGVLIDKLVAGWAPYYAASNEPTRYRDMARSMTQGSCDQPANVRVTRASGDVKLTSTRMPESALKISFTHDLPGDTFRLLSDDVAYLKLSAVKAADAAHYIDSAANTKGLIIDIRNYPSEFVVFSLGSLLVDKETEFARFTTGDLTNPGTFHWTDLLALRPQKPHYGGKVVILVDEVSQRQAEYTTMALRSRQGAVVIGSTTAGADGSVSSFSLPGGLNTMISGIGVFYPDKRPTQRVGILPDVEVKPAIAGVRAGRDELMEQAIRQILGRDVPLERIQKMIR